MATTREVTKNIEFLFADGLGNNLYDAEDRVHNISSALYQEMDKLRDLVRRLQGWVGYEHISLAEFQTELARHEIAMGVIRDAATRDHHPDRNPTPQELERNAILLKAKPEQFLQGGREIFIGCFHWGMKQYLPEAIVVLFAQWCAETMWTPPMPSYSTCFGLWKDTLPMEQDEEKEG